MAAAEPGLKEGEADRLKQLQAAIDEVVEERRARLVGSLVPTSSTSAYSSHIQQPQSSAELQPTVLLAHVRFILK